MTDSKVDPQSAEPGFSDDVEMGLVPKGGGYELTLTPDLAWLQDPARVYPVEIDPTVTAGITRDTFVQTGISSGQAGSSELKSGTFDGGSTKARSFVKFNLSGLHNKEIISADFSLYEFHSWSCTASQINASRVLDDWDGSVTWSNQPSVGNAFDTKNVAKGFSGSCPAGRITFDATAPMEKWSDYSEPNYGIRVRADNESANNGWKKFRSEDYGGASTDPKLEVTYNSYPTSVSARSPTSGVVSADSTPTFSAKYNDPDPGDAGHVDYQVCANATCSSVILNGSGTGGVQSGQASPWTVPSGSALTYGQTYWWRARGDDGRVQSPWSAIWAYTANSAAPDEPTGLIPNARVVTTLTPTLSAIYDDDDPEDAGFVRFEVYNATTNALVAAGNGTTVDPAGRSTWAVPTGLTDGGLFYWRAWSDDGTLTSTTTENHEMLVAVGGDVYHATIYTGDPASGGEAMAEEWARINTFTARYEDADVINTRGPTSCPPRLVSSLACEEVRSTSVGGGRGLEGFSTYVGSEGDPLLQQVVSILDPVTEDLSALSETGPISQALAAWQTPPPLQGSTYELYTAIDPETGDEASTWIDARTRMPLKAIYTAQGSSMTSYWDYEAARISMSSLPPDFFNVPRPWNTGVEKRVELLGARPVAQVLDSETGGYFSPYSLGATASITAPTGEQVDLCLSDSYVVELTIAPSEQETINEPDPEITPDPASPTETYVRANYVDIESGESCRPGAMEAPTPDLTVTSMRASSSRAAAAGVVIRESALEIEGNPLDQEYARAGTSLTVVDGSALVSYVVPADAVSYAALLEPSNASTSIVVIGEFDKNTLDSVAANLEPQ
jgi:hypothetical protein